MPKLKSKALKKARQLLRPVNHSDFKSSSDSEFSVKSEEYSHVPIHNLSIPLETLNMDQTQSQSDNNPNTQINPVAAVEAMAKQMENMMQAINNLMAQHTQLGNRMQFCRRCIHQSNQRHR